MKNNIFAVIISAIVILSMLFLYKSHQDKQKRKVLIETVKQNFSIINAKEGRGNYDSVYVKVDTAFFYKGDTFLGKTIIVSE